MNDIQQKTAETEAQIDDHGLFEPSPSTDWRETYAALEVDQEGHR